MAVAYTVHCVHVCGYHLTPCFVLIVDEYYIQPYYTTLYTYMQSIDRRRINRGAWLYYCKHCLYWQRC